MRALAVLLLAIGVLGAVGPGEVGTAARSIRGPFVAKATMVRVVDGTTLMVRIGGKTRLVRLIGVTAPVCACGDQAALLQLPIEVPRGKTLVLRGDPALQRLDGQGRLLVYASTVSSVDLGRPPPGRSR
jgi:hypothetical protein